MILTIGLIKADLVTAGQAIEYFEATSNKNIKNIAAYHLQQATEKLKISNIQSHCQSKQYKALYA